MKKQFSVGEIVESIQGRDKQNLFLILKVDCDTIYLVNGDNRLITSPKIKNARHLISKNVVLDNIKNKILEGKTIFDAEVYSALKKFKEREKGE